MFASLVLQGKQITQDAILQVEGFDKDLLVIISLLLTAEEQDRPDFQGLKTLIND